MDANQADIVAALEAIGASVQSLAAVGNGCPDLLCGFRGVNTLLEIKVPGEGLNARQKPWHRDWRGKAHVVQGISEAIMVVTQVKQ